MTTTNNTNETVTLNNVPFTTGEVEEANKECPCWLFWISKDGSIGHNRMDSFEEICDKLNRYNITDFIITDFSCNIIADQSNKISIDSFVTPKDELIDDIIENLRESINIENEDEYNILKKVTKDSDFHFISNGRTGRIIHAETRLAWDCSVFGIEDLEN